MTEETQEIKTLNIDEVTYQVDELSTEAQALVTKYNNWNRQRAELQKNAETAISGYRDDLEQITSALAELSRQLVGRIRADAEKPPEENPQDMPIATDDV